MAQGPQCHGHSKCKKDQVDSLFRALKKLSLIHIYLINAEDIDALSLLFSAGQETLMVMTTAVTQQKRSAEWAHDLRQPFDKGNFQLIKDLTSG